MSCPLYIHVCLCDNLVSGFLFQEGAAMKIAFQFQCLTWKLERALRNFPYDQLEISEEVQEQVQIAYLEFSEERLKAFC